MAHIIYSYPNTVRICYLLIFWLLFLLWLVLILSKISKYCGEYRNMNYTLLMKAFPFHNIKE